MTTLLRRLLRPRYVVVLVLAALIATIVLTHVRIFNVQTGSMRPALGVWSLVVSVPQDSYKSGDIITFNTTQAGVVTHRLVEIKPDGTMTTKGDFNKTSDGWIIRQSAIIGKKLGPAIPRVGAWLSGDFWQWKFHQKQFWLGVLLTLAALILSWVYLRENEGGHHRQGKRRTSTS